MKRTLKFKGDWSIEMTETQDEIRLLLKKKPQSITILSTDRELNAQDLIEELK